MSEEIHADNPAPAHDVPQTQGVGRRGLLKVALAVSSTAIISGLTETTAGASVMEQSKGSVQLGHNGIKPGTLLKVVNVSGIRAGVLTQAKPDQPVSTARKAFVSGDAYADAGYWFFFHEADGLLAAARVFTAKSSGKQVGYAVMGQRTAAGPHP
jgi:hypothetical protein